MGTADRGDQTGEAHAGAMKVLHPDAQAERMLRSIEELLRGARTGGPGSKNLERAIIQHDTGFTGPGVKTGSADEGGPAEGKSFQKNVYIMNVNTAGGAEQRLQALQMQKQMLQNQLMVLKAMGAAANSGARLGARTGRIESAAKDMAMGMKSSSAETARVMGEAAATNAATSDVARSTAEMSQAVDTMSKTIEEIEGAIKDLESDLGHAAGQGAGKMKGKGSGKGSMSGRGRCGGC
jgi:hypothetical protein